jgi:hypothetical protein
MLRNLKAQPHKKAKEVLLENFEDTMGHKIVDYCKIGLGLN